MRRSTLTCVLAAVIASLWVSSAFGQDIDGTWLKLTVKGRGINVDNADDSVRRKGAFRGKCYMLVEYDADLDVYTGDTACEIATAVWSETSGGPTFTRFSDEGGYAVNSYVYYTNRRGHAVEGNGTHLLTPIYNRRGVLTKVRLSSYGEVNENSSLDPGTSHFMGGYTVVGVSVVESKVPAGAVSALSGNVGAPPPPGGGVAADILAAVNAHRAAGATCGGTARPPVGALALDPSLNDAAGVHALDMATNDFFSHTGSDGSSPFDRIDAAGFPGGAQGENIAAGYGTAAAVVAGWMDSPGHCNNIMGSAYAFMGAAYAFSASSTYGHYWVQTFGGT